MFPPALPQSHPYKNCNSGKWEKAPSWISEKAAFTSVLQGTQGPRLCKCLKDLYCRQRWAGQWHLHSVALAPTCSYSFFPQTQCPPFFSPAASRSTSGPRLTFPPSQEQVPLPALPPLPITHSVLVLLRDRAAR